MKEGPEKQFNDCQFCRHFHRRFGNIHPICGTCTVGEHFAERIDDSPPDDHELMRMYARMPKDD